MREMGLVADGVKLSPRHPKVPAWQDEQHKAWQERRMEVYAAQVAAMDEGVGRVVDTLKKRGVLDNTLVLYMHDNGACHVEYTESRKGSYLPDKTRDGRPMVPGNRPDVMPGPEHTYQSVGYGWANLGNTPYRLFKQHDHEGGDRSPLIAHWPEGVAARGTFDRTVCHVTDLRPTLLEFAGVAATLDETGESPGRSIAPALGGKELADRETIFWKHARGKALRDGDWKLVAEQKGGWELYDLSSDPTELNDLADDKREKVAAMQKKWDAILKTQQRKK
jgi:arylsulfatase